MITRIAIASTPVANVRSGAGEVAADDHALYLVGALEDLHDRGF